MFARSCKRGIKYTIPNCLEWYKLAMLLLYWCSDRLRGADMDVWRWRSCALSTSRQVDRRVQSQWRDVRATLQSATMAWTHRQLHPAQNHRYAKFLNYTCLKMVQCYSFS